MRASCCVSYLGCCSYESVSAGGGRGSVEAWYTSALDIEEVLSGATDSHVHLFLLLMSLSL